MAYTNYNNLVAVAFGSASPSPTGWYRATCPICLLLTGKEDRRQSLGIRISTWQWHCFRCGKGGRLPGAPTGFEIADMPDVEPADPALLQAPEGFTPLADGDGYVAISFAAARAFLKWRRVSRQTCRELGIGATLEGKAAHRVIVPIRVGREWLGWVGRTWLNSSLRYLYPRGMERGEMLFNSSALQVETDIPAIVVEGVFDALPHYPHAVACLGKPTDTQVEILESARRPIVVALDGDAWREGRNLSMVLNQSRFFKFPVGFLRLPPKTDPGDLKTEDLNLRIRTTMGYKEHQVSNSRIK